MRLAGQAKGGFYPTPERVVDLIAQLIRLPTTYSYYRSLETLRILDPCCGAGEALAQLAERLRHDNGVSIETYGVELHTERAEQAAERLDHALSADLFSTSIANHAFGLCLLNPPYDLGDGRKEAGGARLPHHLHPLPGRGRAAGVHRAPSTSRGLGQVPRLLLL